MGYRKDRILFEYRFSLDTSPHLGTPETVYNVGLALRIMT
jgi:hypothetical protein